MTLGPQFAGQLQMWKNWDAPNVRHAPNERQTREVTLNNSDIGQWAFLGKTDKTKHCLELYHTQLLSLRDKWGVNENETIECQTNYFKTFRFTNFVEQKICGMVGLGLRLWVC